MKIKIISFILSGFIFLSCHKLDLNPLSQASSESWFSNDQQIRMSVDRLYAMRFWNPLQDPLNFWLDAFSDDWTNRNILSPIVAGTINGQTNFVTSWWKNYYECIADANLILAKLENIGDKISSDSRNQYIAEAKFIRAAQYSNLIFHWGNVPYIEKPLTIDESFALTNSDKKDILEKIYSDFDYAASILPATYASGVKYATKGAALALKARIALRMNDWKTAADAAKSCIDLNIYELYPDFTTLFLSKTRNSVESVFEIPRSVSLGEYPNLTVTLQPLPRTASGNDFIQPSWDLLCSFLCSDGKPIDKSPLYNPQKPFLNRDPRCTATIVEFGTPFCGIVYQPHPDSLTTLNLKTGLYVTNLDTRSNTQYASYNGLAWRKGIDDDWVDDYKTDGDRVIVRYADVMLMYAEAKIELGQIDQSVVDMINKVRARAYKVDYTQISDYPAVQTLNQSELRKILRIERRMEFAFEGLRYPDIIRWKLAEKVLNTTDYGMIDPPEQRIKIVQPGLWFFPETTPVDDDGQADFSSMFNKGYIKILSKRSFDKNKHYLWPIPSSEIITNSNLKQNLGY